VSVELEWRGTFTDDEVNRLHAEAFGHDLFEDGWLEQVQRWSLGWVTSRPRSTSTLAASVRRKPALIRL